MFDLKVKNWVVFGLKGSGKTEFIKYIVQDNRKPTFIYDWHGEYDKIKGSVFYYIPKHKDNPDKRRLELSNVVQKMVIDKKDSIRVFVLSEASQYLFPKPTPLPSAIRDIIDNNRHYKQTSVFDARRPTQLHTDIVELADFRVFFKLTGKNDIRYMNDLYDGLGEMVKGLKLYEFVILADEPKKFKPIPL